MHPLWFLVIGSLARIHAQPTEYIVTYSDLSQTDLETKCNLLNCTRIFNSVIQGIVITKDPSGIAALSADDPSVGSFSRNSKVSLSQVLPGFRDPLDYHQLNAPYHLDRLDQLTLPLDGVFTPYNDCFGVNIYVLDTGIRRTHDEFLSVDGSVRRVSDGYSIATLPGNGTDDCQGHGTHVSSIIAGRTVGVCKAGRIIPVRILDCGGDANIVDLVTGLDWIVKDVNRTNNSRSIISEYPWRMQACPPRCFRMLTSLCSHVSCSLWLCPCCGVSSRHRRLPHWCPRAVLRSDDLMQICPWVFPK